MLPESIEKERAIGKLQRANFRQAYLAGAPLTLGTDGGVYPHGDNARQFATMIEFGCNPIDALRTTTVNAARLNLYGKAGMVKADSLADVIAVESDSRANVEHLQHVRFVMKDGASYRDEWEPLLVVRK